MTESSEELSILFCSDLHFGGLNFNAQQMAESFGSAIFPLLPKTDVMFINGDFFDTLVSFDSNGFDPIYALIVNLFYVCQEHGVVLRIMQGTWEHDRNQGKRFEAIYRSHNYQFDFAFMGKIDLEQIEIKNRTLRILYMPDDLPGVTCSEDALEIVQQKLVEKGWSQVDYACVHGFFDFTLPAKVAHDGRVVYRESQFDFVMKLVDVGHVHQYQAKGKVISNGSFDRGCFNDEAPKGFIMVKDYRDRCYPHFMENTTAAVYDTLVFSEGDDTDTLREKTSQHLQSLTTERDISLRFSYDTLEQRSALSTWMRESYPDVKIKFKKNKDFEEDNKPLISSGIQLTALATKEAPTPATLSTFIKAYLPDNYSLTVEEIDAHLQST